MVMLPSRDVSAAQAQALLKWFGSKEAFLEWQDEAIRAEVAERGRRAMQPSPDQVRAAMAAAAAEVLPPPPPPPVTPPPPGV